MPRQRTSPALTMERFREVLEELPPRFWPNVSKEDDCWNWTGEKSGTHYGIIDVDGFLEGAHRVAWWLATETIITPDRVILHTCDNRGCVRNDDPGIYVVAGVALPRVGHLALGTNGDNIRDYYAKYGIGQLKKPAPHVLTGEAIPWSRLTNAQAEDIRQRYATTDVTKKKLAQEYGVSIETVKKLLRGTTYAGPDTVPIRKSNGGTRGADRPGASLTWDQVSEIRRLQNPDAEAFRALAIEYGVATGLIRKVAAGKTYLQT